MQERVYRSYGPPLRYYTHGNNPRLLVHSGTHGNERGVISSVERYLTSHAEAMPEFIFVPEVSPSAVAKRTRKNAAGRDVNRMFTDVSPDLEVRANQAIIHNHWFDLFLSFHEDPERTNEWYLFDTNDYADSASIRDLFAAATDAGITPYSGPDGTIDGTVLIRNGYFSEQWPGGGFTRERLSGQAPIYAVRKGIAKRGLTLEIPGLAPQDVKDKLVAIIFEHLLRLELRAPE